MGKCGALAELPRTQASQLVGCFEETCGCRSKLQVGATDGDDELLRQYFDLIHNQERVEYLMLQQQAVEQIVAKEADVFLTDSNPEQVKRILNSEEGVRYYEQYLGRVKHTDGAHHTETIFLYLGILSLVVSALAYASHHVWKRLRVEGPREGISVDCENAIRKKQRLEQGIKK